MYREFNEMGLIYECGDLLIYNNFDILTEPVFRNDHSEKMNL